MYVLKKLFIII